MIKSLCPKIFAPHPDIQAFFTLANRQHPREKTSIEGLNFGINTPDKPKIIQQNRVVLANEFGIDSNSFVIAEQVHGNSIEIVDEPGFFKRTDGLITETENLILAIQVADCAAVFVSDVQNNIIGIFHAGWRGAAANIVSLGVRKMSSLSKISPVFKAYISPCISEKNFEVGSEVAEYFPSEFVNYTSFKKPHINLKAYLKAELMDAGVKEKNIEVSERCTVDDSQFYSYRRERDKAGRMLACMYMNKSQESICE